MSRGRPQQLFVTLSPEERVVLAHLVRQTTVPLVQVRPARLLLLLDVGHSLSVAAAAVGLSRVRAYKWVHRFHAEGLVGLRARPQGGWRGTRRLSAAARVRGAIADQQVCPDCIARRQRDV
jgi:Winged helix-turn helix